MGVRFISWMTECEAFLLAKVVAFLRPCAFPAAKAREPDLPDRHRKTRGYLKHQARLTHINAVSFLEAIEIVGVYG